MFCNFYQDRKVFVTGHTGFKGSWLCEWLLHLGAHPVGYSLQPKTKPALFEQLGLARRMDHNIYDIRDPGVLQACVEACQPDIVFHLAAQPLVRRSYADPVHTYETNVMGTINLLEAVKHLKKPCAVVVITTDKCYENHEWIWGYRENDALGGHDPYSASKACSELVVQSYRKSFFGISAKKNIALASARAGNVIGGGDWAEDRIVPDCIRALLSKNSITVRNPNATRPWQHVLEPLSGYLRLGQLLYPDQGVASGELCSAFNFGPNVESNQTVGALVDAMLGHWPGDWKDQSDPNAPHEAGLLNLNIDKAWNDLKWRPVWEFSTTVKETMQWYREITESGHKPECISEFTRKQIAYYCENARQKNLAWAVQYR